MGVKAPADCGENSSKSKDLNFVVSGGDPHRFCGPFLLVNGSKSASHPGVDNVEAKDEHQEYDRPDQVVPGDFARNSTTRDFKAGNTDHARWPTGPVDFFGKDYVHYDPKA